MFNNAVLRRLWCGVSWFGIALLLYLSFTPQPPEIPMDQGDKLGHALAYAVLMYWSGQLLPGMRRRMGLAAGLVALGIGIEFVQRWTGWRSFDYYDMLADAVGVALGLVLTAIVPNPLKLLVRNSKPAG